MLIKAKGKIFAILCAVVVLGVMIVMGLNSDKSISAETKTALDITDRISVPILLYNNIAKETGQLGDYCITPSEFENDLLYIKENGYTAIHMQELIDYCYRNRPLPDKPIIITFDGGFESSYDYAYPLLQKYSIKAVYSIVGANIDAASTQHGGTTTAYIKWNELRDLTESGLIEVANQSYNMNDYVSGKRKGIAKLKAESIEDYINILNEDVGRMQKEISDKIGYLPTTFSYPYGIICRESVDIISELGFAATFSCEPGVNYLSGFPNELYALRRNIRPYKLSSEDFFRKMYRTKLV